MKCWQDKTTYHQATPSAERGAQRPVRSGGAPVPAPAGDDDFFFSFERKIFNPPGTNEAVPLGPTCKGTNSAGANHRKAESIFIILAAAKASPHGPTCKGTSSPSHTRPSAAPSLLCPSLLCLLAASQVFCPAKQFFSIFCRHSSPLFSGISRVVPTSDRDDSPECRCCRHTNPHFTGNSKVAPTLVVTFSTLRVQTRHHNPHPKVSPQKPAFHRDFQGDANIPFRSTRAKSQNAQPEIEISIPQAILNTNVAETSMAQAPLRVPHFSARQLLVPFPSHLPMGTDQHPGNARRSGAIRSYR
jgi:hypothetical protein